MIQVSIEKAIVFFFCHHIMCPCLEHQVSIGVCVIDNELIDLLGKVKCPRYTKHCSVNKHLVDQIVDRVDCFVFF